MRILIAEDETIIRLDLRTLLEKAGHEVVAEARDGEEAVALAAEHDPDLIVMDVRMPHLDGIEAARQISNRKPVPIVMLTAYAEEDLVTRASEAGAFAYLVKPFREVDLLPALNTARARFEELSALREEAADLGVEVLDHRVVFGELVTDHRFGARPGAEIFVAAAAHGAVVERELGEEVFWEGRTGGVVGGEAGRRLARVVRGGEGDVAEKWFRVGLR